MKDVIESNGLTYPKSDDETVLIKIINKDNGKYFGMNYQRDKKLGVFVLEDVFYTNKDNAFIFMLSREVFNDFGITTILEMLKSNCTKIPKYNASSLKAELV